MIGFKIIKEMSKEELIDEILAGQRKELEEKELLELKSIVIEFRVLHTREALTKEAGLKRQDGPFGSSITTEDES